MKVRNDFVTNSNSSSFIIAYRTLPNIDDDTLEKYPFLRGYGKLIEKVLFTEGDNETDEGIVSRTKEEYDENFIKIYGWKNLQTVEDILEDDDDLIERYNKAIEYIEKGFNILDKRVDYNDTYCTNMIRELAEDKDNFIILEAE